MKLKSQITCQALGQFYVYLNNQLGFQLRERIRFQVHDPLWEQLSRSYISVISHQLEEDNH
jgi:hypothetical protein